MAREDTSGPRSALLSFRFLGTSLVGSLAMALVSALAPPAAQVAVLGGLVSILGGLFLAYLGQDEERERRRGELLERLSVPLALASDPELFARYAAICRGLTGLVTQQDPVLRDAALLKLASVAGQISDLAKGRVVFAGTEGWRSAYEELLRSPAVREYRSAAWVRAADYWQDGPGRQSMRANYEAVHRGVLVERVVILRDEFWPAGDLLPGPQILPWIEEQHNHGVRVRLVRESEVADEADLPADFGIYGDRAVGTLEADERSRPARFTLSFDPDEVHLAEDRWRRLVLYAVSFRDLLDRSVGTR